MTVTDLVSKGFKQKSVDKYIKKSLKKSQYPTSLIWLDDLPNPEFLQIPSSSCKFSTKSLQDPASCVFFCKYIPASFHANSCKLIHVFHAKKNQKNVTEILQHLHACNSNTEVFYGREVELKILKQYMQGPCNKPFVLYGKGGSGKTAMLSIAGSKGLQEWLKPGKPLLIIRYHSFQLSKLIPSADCFVLYFASSIITVTDWCCFVVCWIILLHSMWNRQWPKQNIIGLFRSFLIIVLRLRPPKFFVKQSAWSYIFKISP